MRRTAALLLLAATGCSNVPLADCMDFVFPGRIKATGPGYGGVAAQQLAQPAGSTVAPDPAVALPGVPSPPAPPPGVAPPPPP